MEGASSRSMWHQWLGAAGQVLRCALCDWHASGSIGARVAYSHAQPTPPTHRGTTLSLFGWEDSMRSIRLLTATTVILAGAWACGDGGGDTGTSEDPTADFAVPACTAGTVCTFTDNSSD